MDYISQVNVGGTGYIVGLPNIYVNNKGNFNIETSAELGNTSKGKINIESMSDIQFKPGDDIILYSHHRAENKQDEVAVKVTDGDDVPVKLQLNAAELVLTTKDKTGNNANVMDVTVNSAQNTRGYLKLRAQAIDLRSETHGGIALQPKGKDSQNHMNKIKFEHGGGDGLEFGTFNTEKTSIFTDEYRFNKDGIWKMATREKVASDKADPNDATTSYKYVKQGDDFYDIVSQDDEQCTTKDIIKTAHALNGHKNRHTKITDKGNIEIAAIESFSVAEYTGETTGVDVLYDCPSNVLDPSVVYNRTELAAVTGDEAQFVGYWLAADSENNKVNPYSGSAAIGLSTAAEAEADETNTKYYTITAIEVPKINLESEKAVQITSKQIELNASDKLKLGGILDFGSNFNFGETDEGIEFQYKLTKKNAEKDCGVLKVVGVNNHESNDLTVEGVTIAPGQTETIAQCSMLDIIKLVNYMKTNNEGPWASQL